MRMSDLAARVAVLERQVASLLASPVPPLLMPDHPLAQPMLPIVTWAGRVQWPPERIAAELLVGEAES